MKRNLFTIIAMALCCAATAPAEPVSGWNQAQLEQLRHWVRAAPEDALPLLDTASLDAAESGGDPAAVDAAATALALHLARMHLLGAATSAQRTGWRIPDSDSASDLPSRLERAVKVNAIDLFFAGLKPQHSDYAALRAAYATETDPNRKRTLARNMERWRWMPLSLGQDYVLVNAASFEAGLWRQGRRVGTWRVIVGKKSTSTPVFSAMITGVTFNPWWEIPASIVREKRGNFPARLGYVVSGGKYRQRPGANNALGRMKLVMPNPYNVYMHDTPGKHLFERDVRAFSHGCIRVSDALGYAATLLEGVKTREEVDAIVAGRKTVTTNLASSLPVYITYFTASIKGDGNLAIQPDIYGRDTRIDTVPARKQGCPTE